MAPLKPTQSSSLQPDPHPNPALKWLACALLVACVVVLAASVWASMSSEADNTPAASAPQGGQVVVEPGAQPSPEEMATADYLAKQGHRVRLLRRDPASSDPQPDAQLDDDDFPTEIKTVGNITSEDVTGRLAGRIRQALGQAPSVVVDAREQAELTTEEIERALERAVGRARVHKKTIKRIHVIGPNGIDIVRDYTGNIR